MPIETPPPITTVAGSSPDWIWLPDVGGPALDRILSHLNLAEQSVLCETIPSWRDAMTQKNLQAGARALIEARERGQSDRWPRELIAELARHVRDPDKYPHVRMLVELQHICDQLSSVSCAKAGYRDVGEHFILAPEFTHKSHAGEPMFAGLHPDRIGCVAFAGNSDRIECTPATAGYTMMSSSFRRFTVVNSMHSRRDGLVALQSRDGSEKPGTPVLYRPSSGDLVALSPLHGLGSDDIGAVSENGRFVAVVYNPPKLDAPSQLMVLDRGNQLLVTDTSLRPTRSGYTSVSVDSAGTALVATNDGYGLEVEVGGSGTQAAETPLLTPWGLYTLSPGEGYVILDNEDTRQVVLRPRRGGDDIKLIRPEPPGEVRTTAGAVSIAFAPGLAMVNIVYQDGGGGVFDLTESVTGERLPKLWFRLPDVTDDYWRNPMAGFARAGRELHVIYQAKQGGDSYSARILSLPLTSDREVSTPSISQPAS